MRVVQSLEIFHFCKTCLTNLYQKYLQIPIIFIDEQTGMRLPHLIFGVVLQSI